jgi:hypothetical protein
MVESHTRHHDAAVVISHLRALEARRYRKVVRLRNRHEQRLRDTINTGPTEGRFACPDVKMATYAISQMATGPSTWFQAGGPLSIRPLCDIHTEPSGRMLSALPDVEVEVVKPGGPP